MQYPAAPTTYDIDLTPEATKQNLERLSAALHELGARIRTDAIPDGLAFDHSGTSLGNVEVWTLTCPLGDFDISFRPAAFAGEYSELVIRAKRTLIGMTDVLIADLADIIRLKEAAGRSKDLRALPILYEGLAEREQSA